jgi:predicted GH43/DUF377 family glycosyl hydrolase
MLLSDDRRVILRYLDFHHPPRIRAILRRLLRIPEEQVVSAVRTAERFLPRHRNGEEAFLHHYALAVRHLHYQPEISDRRKMFIGACFTMEYSIEAAALFNPSIVPHPDQSGTEDGAVRFLMSLRATGEGHVSSIVFRRGTIVRTGEISFDPPPRWAYAPPPERDKLVDKASYVRDLAAHGMSQDRLAPILAELDDTFRTSRLRQVLDRHRGTGTIGVGWKRLRSTMLWVAIANYELHIPPDCQPAEAVIFPATAYESRGMEDVRLVLFTDDDGRRTYYGTYTAYDGHGIYPMLLETADFHDFRVRTLGGRFARNKGMALFPRKIAGSYAMLSRHDGENIYVMLSDDLYSWERARQLLRPSEPWDVVQVGNCGSPLETDRGWLVLTHGVGPLRQYSIGAVLLDIDDPTRIVGRLREPLLVPTIDERRGYVPNVVYTCGSMIHGGQLVVPYAMSDSRTGFATVPVDELVTSLIDSGP